MVKRDLITALRTAVGDDRVLTGAAFAPYSRDATFMVAPATAAVLPASTKEVAVVVRLCAEAGSPIVARGSGTGLAGGPVPVGGGVVLSLERLQDLDIDTANSCAVAGAGVITGELQTAATQHGLFYPPDPASVALSTIGGNVACNAGGMSCLKYGVTSDYVIGMTVVLADGNVLRLGGKLRKRASGYRLAQLFVGSEGTLGIVTELVLKLIPLPRHRATAMIGSSTPDWRGPRRATKTRALALIALLALAACAPAETPQSASPSGAAPPVTSERPSPSAAPALIAPLPGEPTVSLYLPYVTKTLGGVDGFETPFIVQNADRVITDLELNFYAIADGTLVARRIVRGLRPGTSYADRPNRDSDLRDDAAYSAVIRSFGAKIVAVVNQQRGTGSRFEADSYVSQVGGARNLYLPSVARRLDGFISRIVVQNVDTEPTVATAAFVSLDGASSATLTRTIDPGRSSVIDLGAERDLADGTRYAVRISGSARLVAIVNSQRDASSPGAPVLYTYSALTDGANTVYGPYVVKNVPGVGAGDSTITVQNMSTAASQPSLSFTPLGGGVTTRFDGPNLAPGAGWSFDPRFRSGDDRQTRCGAGPSPGCVGDGEYSFSAGAPGAQLAAVVIVIGPTTAAAYTGLARPGDFFLPNVTRTLGGRNGWTTPIVVQSVSASRITLSWYRFTDGVLAATQPLTITPGSALRIDPRNVPGLSDEAQYSVVLEGNGGRLVAVVVQLNFGGGDGAAIYTGFAR